jgi:toluene monooxygenase system ferredoxin subunit
LAFTRVCGLDDLPVDTMNSFFVEDVEVLVVRSDSGVHAFDGICPHEEFPLVDGYLVDSTITCIGHGWIFDALTGQGVYPPGCRLSEYPLKIENSGIYVDVDSVVRTSESG